jgi:hypothetical protein
VIFEAGAVRRFYQQKESRWRGFEARIFGQRVEDVTAKKKTSTTVINRVMQSFSDDDFEVFWSSARRGRRGRVKAKNRCMAL